MWLTKRKLKLFSKIIFNLFGKGFSLINYFENMEKITVFKNTFRKNLFI